MSEQSQVAEVLGSNIVSVDREDSPPHSEIKAPDRLNRPSSASNEITLEKVSVDFFMALFQPSFKVKGPFSRIKRMLVHQHLQRIKQK